MHEFAHSHAVNNLPTLVTHSNPPVRPRLPTTDRPEVRNSGPPHCLQRRAGHTVEGGVLSQTRSARLTYHIREPRPSVIRERPRRRPCASASGIAIEIPLHAYLTARCGVGYPVNGLGNPVTVGAHRLYIKPCILQPISSEFRLSVLTNYFVCTP